MSSDRKPVIVSLTPLPLSADSRTLKQVTSVHRFGFESIVIEGRESGFKPGALPLEVISIHSRENAGASSVNSAKSDANGRVVAAPAQFVEALSFSGLRPPAPILIWSKLVPFWMVCQSTSTVSVPVLANVTDLSPLTSAPSTVFESCCTKSDALTVPRR